MTRFAIASKTFDFEGYNTTTRVLWAVFDEADPTVLELPKFEITEEGNGKPYKEVWEDFNSAAESYAKDFPSYH